MLNYYTLQNYMNEKEKEKKNLSDKIIRHRFKEFFFVIFSTFVKCLEIL